ncbi:hypothetical protein [Ructibacterium gallinarum]|uniref:Uncharacterized protein n=1 Tax=Ructibacterium gallinarum TaxID=2779355 RepID=A0A9D5M1P4_9FIRM|nr:hypothetical protein [Ructibacterium gallinarum]MBE5039788.1 hypothetical protein [Ructibacterium gallinarum]
MAADMKERKILATETESGGVVRLLAELSGAPETEMEQMLQTGITPWKLAQNLGVLSEFRDALLERLFSQLQNMVENNQITQQHADDMIAYFETYVPAADER